MSRGPARAEAFGGLPQPSALRSFGILARRIIARLDVPASLAFRRARLPDPRVAADTLDLATRLQNEGADELVIYGLNRSPEHLAVCRAWVQGAAERLDIPFCVAGVRSVVAAEEFLRAGAEKVSVNFTALENPTLIDLLAWRFGSPCVVVGIASLRTPGEYRVWATGDRNLAYDSGRNLIEWLHEVQERGTGQIVLNCTASDGACSGYDIEQLAAVRGECRVPLVASGGAGAVEHFVDAFAHAGVDAVLAGEVFHSGAVRIPELKRELRCAGIPIRLTATFDPVELRSDPVRLYPA